MLRKALASSLAAALMLTGCSDGGSTVATPVQSSTAIKHVVVIFGENVSFDHYFGTYPNAKNPTGEPTFVAAANTPTVDGLTSALLTANPNATNPANGAGATNPFRLDRSQAVTNDQDHNYGAEQMAFDNGAMDLFPLSVGVADSSTLQASTGASSVAATAGLTMGYYDGNTVTALWNYAQRFAINDHSFGTTFGPSTPGALNLVSGQTNGVVNDLGASGKMVDDGQGGFTLVSDVDPTGDICSSTTAYAHMTGKNVGDMLTAANVTWGWFEGGFDLTQSNSNGTTGCHRSTKNIGGGSASDYIPHHEPFQYYVSTANPNHTRPNAVANIGTNTDGANHQYDMHDFTDALNAGVMPAVSFLKAPGYQDGHAGYSDPLDEQKFIVDTINAIENSPFWSSTAIIINYDDSDGWYDHAMQIVNGSTSAQDMLSGNGVCASSTASGANALAGVNTTNPVQGRCGYGPRLPMLVISPWAKQNYVDSTVTDQSSILRFIEDVFLKGARVGQGSFDSIAGPLDGMFDFSTGKPRNLLPLLLNDSTGQSGS